MGVYTSNYSGAEVDAAIGKANTALQSSDIVNKADKDIDAVAGNIAKFDANGNPVDAGIAANNIAEKANTLAGYGIQDAYTKTEVNGLVDTPHQHYVTVATYAELANIASPSDDTIYRVSSYDGAQSQVDNTVYSEYAWNGTQYIFLAVKPNKGEVFDITVYNNNATYADLSAALGVNGANVPPEFRYGGMSVKFVQSSDNKYVQYRLMSDSFNIIPRNWQGVDIKPTGGSKNLVESGGAFKLYQDYILPLYQGVPSNPSMLTRVQTEYIKVSTGFKIKVTEGYYVYTVYKYNPETFNEIQDLTINDTEWTSDGEYLIKVVFKNGFAGTDSLSPNDEIIKEVNDLFSIFTPSIKEEQNIKIASIRGLLKLQNNVLDITTGGTGDASEIRVCTGYLKPPFKIILNNGYLIYDLYKYNADYTYKGRSSVVTVNSKTLDLPATDPYEIVRFTIKNGSAGTDTLSNQDDLVFDYTGSAAAEESEVKQETAKVASLSAAIDVNTIDIDLNSLIIEDGAINIAGQDDNASNRLRTKGYIYGTKKITLPAGFMIYMVLYYNSETLAFDSYVDVTASTYTIGKSNCVARFSICKTDRTQPVTVSELKQVLSLELLNKEIKDINNTVKSLAPQPTAIRFDIDHNVKDFSDILSHVTITPTTGMMERVYALFDQLVALYPDYVSKFDPMASSDTTQTVTVDGVDHTITVNAMSDIKTAMAGAGFNDYPVYAKGITETVSETITNVDGTTYTVEYTSTPAYKTYMYKFACERDYINTNLNKKEKVFLLSNTHGNEVSAPLNLYLFMKQLCDGVINDGNFYKFRAAFDFYVVPHLNGYGCYHSTRCNARRVDLNRNFPITGWSIAGKSTIDDDNLCEFTGPNAGSEFETQLVVNLVEAINPVFACDLHNHGGGTCQLYSGLINKNDILFTKLAQQASVDMAIAFGKNYPEYFGTGYHDILFGATADAPGYNTNLNLPHTYCWWNEYGVKFPCLIEIGTKIDWRNGEQEDRVDTWFSADFFSIAEYTLRIQLIRYFQYLLDNKNYL